MGTGTVAQNVAGAFSVPLWDVAAVMEPECARKFEINMICANLPHPIVVPISGVEYAPSAKKRERLSARRQCHP